MVIINKAEDNKVKESKKKISENLSEKFRYAKKAFVFMHSNTRVSRDLRAQWFFKNLNNLIKVRPDFNMVV